MNRIGLGHISSIGPGIWWIMVSMIVFALVGLIYVIKQYGQGGSFIEQSAEAGELTGGLADNAHWICGVLYINREDPSMIIENRFGIGYTMNYGNWRSVAFSFVFATLLLSLIVLGVFFL